MTTKNIKEIYSDFNLEPLQPNDEKLYPEYFGKLLVHTQKRIIARKLHNFKHLIIGHKGSGKSTFLNLLAIDEQLQKDFLIVHYSIRDIGNEYDFSHFDFLLSLTLKGTEVAHQQKVKIDKKLLVEIERMVKIITGDLEIEMDQETKKEVKGGGEFNIGTPQIPIISNWLSAKVFGALQMNDLTRKKLREKYKIKQNELLNAVNDFLIALASNSKKRLLFLVDDMDKIPPKLAAELLDVNRYYLQKPQANIVYMVDISHAADSRIAAGLASIGRTIFFHSLKLSAPESVVVEKNSLETITKNYQLLKNLIHHWCPSEYFNKVAVKKLIEYGGGNTTETLRLLWYAIDYAVIERKVQTIGEPDIERAAIRRYNEFALNQTHVDILMKVKKNPLWRPEKDQDIKTLDSPYLDLIYNLALFEYRNGDQKLHRPHPVLLRFLK